MSSNSPSILFILPPVVKPSEPPPGIAKLAGALATHRIEYDYVDANIEGILFLLHKKPVVADTWTFRAFRNLQAHLAGLSNISLYEDCDRYRRAVSDINRLLNVAGRGFEGIPGIADYTAPNLSPVNSQDLLYSAEHPENNPFFDYMEKRLSPRIEAAAPPMVGISVGYLSQALTGFAIAGFLKQRFPQMKIIMGGGLITSWMKTASWSGTFSGLVEEFVAGPGELRLLELLGKPDETCNIYRPVYEAFSREYLSPGPVLPYAASSGCYWGRCSFCPERAEGNIYKPVPAPTAVRHLAELSREIQPSLIHLVDNALSPVMLASLIENSPGPPWYGFARITRELTDIDFCRGLRQSGCVMLKLGVESGDQNVLDHLEKGATVELSSKVLKTLHSTGISTYVYLLFGTPAETKMEAEKTLAFTSLHSQFIDFLNVAIFNLPLNSPEAAKVNTTVFYEGDCPLYVDFAHPNGWGRREVRHFLDREFRRNRAIAGIIRNQPPFFTSNHAPFFAIHGKKK